MNATLEPTAPLTQESLRAEATAVEKLRREISAGSATPARMAEFAKRQKAYLDRKIEFEKLKRIVVELPAKKAAPTKAETKREAPKKAETPKPETPKTAAPAPQKTVESKPAKPAEDKTSAVTPPPSRERKSSAHWIWWLLLAATAGLVAWIVQ